MLQGSISNLICRLPQVLVYLALPWVLVGANASGAESFCYVPGVGGLKSYAKKDLGPELSQRRVPYILFDVSVKKPIQVIAQDLCKILETQTDLDKNFRCHFFGYSMGGVMLRYASHHLTCTHSKTGEKIPFRHFMASLTSAATPHLGTPVADLGAGFGLNGPEANQVSEAGIKAFNDPQFTETYSPRLADIPTFSIESFIKDRNEAAGTLEKLGFDYLKKIFRDRGVEEPLAISDGVVPTTAQKFGIVLERLRVPHGFFGSHGGVFDDKKLPDFIAFHWERLQKWERDGSFPVDGFGSENAEKDFLKRVELDLLTQF